MTARYALLCISS